MVRKWLESLLGTRELIDLYKERYEREHSEKLQLQNVLLEMTQVKSVVEAQQAELVSDANKLPVSVGRLASMPRLLRSLEVKSKKILDTNSEKIMKAHKEQVEKDIAEGRLASETTHAS